MPFFKKHIVSISENAVNPDKRRYSLKNEAPRHFIDLDVYGKDGLKEVPHRWDSAVSKYSEDTLLSYGIVPWHTYRVYHWLRKAFEEKNLDAILRHSADLGHYIADANVPLHTTENYNGQLTHQHGIHGFWESRLPELYSKNYDFFVGRANYIPDVQEYIWTAIEKAHLAKDSVLLLEQKLNEETKPGKKYSYETRGATNVKVYSKPYSYKYHMLLNGMVERRMRASIKMIGDIWYTAWADAGQPELSELLTLDLTDKEKRKLNEDKTKWESRTVKSREHN